MSALGRAAGFGFALILVCACGSIGRVSTSSSPSGTHAAAAINVTGTIDRGSAPPCPPGEPCDPPIVATMLVFSRQGLPDVTVRIGTAREFALHLDPGAYTIAAAPEPMLGRLQPSTVRVPQDGVVVLELRISS